MKRDRPTNALQAFLQGESAGGVLLIGAAILALLVANSGLGPTYRAALHAYFAGLSLLHWVNDGLMASACFSAGILYAESGAMEKCASVESV